MSRRVNFYQNVPTNRKQYALVVSAALSNNIMVPFKFSWHLVKVRERSWSGSRQSSFAFPQTFTPVAVLKMLDQEYDAFLYYRGSQ